MTQQIDPNSYGASLADVMEHLGFTTPRLNMYDVGRLASRTGLDKRVLSGILYDGVTPDADTARVLERFRTQELRSFSTTLRKSVPVLRNGNGHAAGVTSEHTHNGGNGTSGDEPAHEITEILTLTGNSDAEAPAANGLDLANVPDTHEEHATAAAGNGAEHAVLNGVGDVSGEAVELLDVGAPKGSVLGNGHDVAPLEPVAEKRRKEVPEPLRGNVVAVSSDGKLTRYSATPTAPFNVQVWEAGREQRDAQRKAPAAAPAKTALTVGELKSALRSTGVHRRWLDHNPEILRNNTGPHFTAAAERGELPTQKKLGKIEHKRLLEILHHTNASKPNALLSDCGATSEEVGAINKFLAAGPENEKAAPAKIAGRGPSRNR